jgi:tetratricopeptide (TPR) repeat protein
MSAQDLFQQGVAAIRDEKDLIKGRNLLTQALRLNPANDMAWLWLSRTINDPEKKIQCFERALKINPNNEQALKLLDRAKGTTTEAAVAKPPPSPPTTQTKAAPSKTTNPVEQLQIASLLQKAQTYMDQQKPESAIEQWVRVLEIEPDHEVALSSAVRHLSRLRYIEDAKELVWNALNSGTQHPSVYLTAIDIAKREEDQGQMLMLREKVATLPAVSEDIIISNVDYLLENHHFDAAHRALVKAVENQPKNQKILLRMGNVLEELDRPEEAVPYFERVVKLGTRTPEGKEAEGKYNQFAPTLTDKERGSTLLAVRESAGIGLFILILGWMDAGLNVLQMGVARWLGVLIGLLGGYLVITATSSPQQQPLATWLGGEIPEPDEPEIDEFGNKIVKEKTQLPIISPAVRSLIGVVGLLVLGLAVYLVFSRTIHLMTNPVPAPNIPTFDEWLAEITGQ